MHIKILLIFFDNSIVEEMGNWVLNVSFREYYEVSTSWVTKLLTWESYIWSQILDELWVRNPCFFAGKPTIPNAFTYFFFGIYLGHWVILQSSILNIAAQRKLLLYIYCNHAVMSQFVPTQSVANLKTCGL